MEKFNILTDWSFCCAVKAGPKETQRYLSTLDKLTDPAAGGQMLNVAFQQLVLADSWLQIYAFPKAIGVLKRPDFPFAAVRESALDYFTELTTVLKDVYNIDFYPAILAIYDEDADWDDVSKKLHALSLNLLPVAFVKTDVNHINPYHDVYEQLPFIALLSLYNWFPADFFTGSEVTAEGSALRIVLGQAISYAYGRMGFLLAVLLSQKIPTGLSTDDLLTKILTASWKGTLEEADLVAAYVRLVFADPSKEMATILDDLFTEYRSLKEFKLLFHKLELTKGAENGLVALSYWQASLLDLAVLIDPPSAAGPIRDFYQLPDNEPNEPARVFDWLGEDHLGEKMKELLLSLKDKRIEIVKTDQVPSNGWLYYSPALSLFKSISKSGIRSIDNPATWRVNRQPRYIKSDEPIVWIRLASALFNVITLLRALEKENIAAKQDLVFMVSHISHILSDYRLWLTKWETGGLNLENYKNVKPGRYFPISTELTGLLMSCQRQIKFMAAGYIAAISPEIFYQTLMAFKGDFDNRGGQHVSDPRNDRYVLKRYYYINELLSWVFDNYLGAAGESTQTAWLRHLPEYCVYFASVSQSGSLINSKEKLLAAVLERHLLKVQKSSFYGLTWQSNPGNKMWEMPYNYFLISETDLRPEAWLQSDWGEFPDSNEGKTTKMFCSLERFVSLRLYGNVKGVAEGIAEKWLQDFKKVIVEVEQNNDIYRLTRLRLIEVIADDRIWTNEPDIRELIAWHLLEFGGAYDLVELFRVFFPHADGVLIPVSASKENLRTLLLTGALRATEMYRQTSPVLLKTQDYFKLKSRESRNNELERLLQLCAASGDSVITALLKQTSVRYLEETQGRDHFEQVSLDVYYRNGKQKISTTAFSGNIPPAQLIRGMRFDAGNRIASAYYDKHALDAPLFSVPFAGQSTGQTISTSVIYAGIVKKGLLSFYAFNCGLDDWLLTPDIKGQSLVMGEVVQCTLSRQKDGWRIDGVKKLPVNSDGQLLRLKLTTGPGARSGLEDYLSWNGKKDGAIPLAALDISAIVPDISRLFSTENASFEMILRFDGQFYQPYYRYFTDLLLEMEMYGRFLTLTFIREMPYGDQMGWLFSLEPGKNFLLYPFQFGRMTENGSVLRLINLLAQFTQEGTDPCGLLITVTPEHHNNQVLLKLVTAEPPRVASFRQNYERLQLPFDKRNIYWKNLFSDAEAKNISLFGHRDTTNQWYLTDLDFAQVGFPPIKLDGINRIESDAEVTIDPRDWLFGRYVAKVRADEVQTMALCSNNSLGTGFDINRLKFFLKTYPYWKKDDSILISRAVATNWSAGEVACLTPEGVSVRLDMDSYSMAPVSEQIRDFNFRGRVFRIENVSRWNLISGDVGLLNSAFAEGLISKRELSGIVVEKPRDPKSDWCYVAWFVGEEIEIEKVTVKGLHHFRYYPGAKIEAYVKDNKKSVRLFQRNVFIRAQWRLISQPDIEIKGSFFLFEDKRYAYFETPKGAGIIVRVALPFKKSFYRERFNGYEPLPGTGSFNGRVVLKNKNSVLTGFGRGEWTGVENVIYELKKESGGYLDLQRDFTFYPKHRISKSKGKKEENPVASAIIVDEYLRENIPLKGYYNKKNREVTIKSQDFTQVYGEADWEATLPVGNNYGPFCTTGAYSPVIDEFYLFSERDVIYADLINEKGFLSPEAFMARYGSEVKKNELPPFFFVEKRYVAVDGHEHSEYLFEWGYGKHLLVPENQLFFNDKVAHSSIDLFRGDQINHISIGYEFTSETEEVIIRILSYQINYTDNAKIYLQRKRQTVHLILIEKTTSGRLLIKRIMGNSERDHRESYYFQNISAALELSPEEELLLSEKLELSGKAELEVYARLNEKFFRNHEKLIFNLLPLKSQQFAAALNDGERVPMIVSGKEHITNDTRLWLVPSGSDKGPKFLMLRRNFSVRENLLDRINEEELIGKIYFIHVIDAKDRFVSLVDMPARQNIVLADLAASQRVVYGIAYKKWSGGVRIELRPGVNVSVEIGSNIYFPDINRCANGDRLRIETELDQGNGNRRIVISIAAFGDRSFFHTSPRPVVLLPKNSFSQRYSFLHKKVTELSKDTFANGFTAGDFSNVNISVPQNPVVSDITKLMSGGHPKVGGIFVDRSVLVIDFNHPVEWGGLRFNKHDLSLDYLPKHDPTLKNKMAWEKITFAAGSVLDVIFRLNRDGWIFHDDETFLWKIRNETVKDIIPLPVPRTRPFIGPLFFDIDSQGFLLRYPASAFLKYGLPIDILINDLDGRPGKKETYAFAGRTSNGRFFLEISPGRLAEFSPGLVYYKDPDKIQLVNFNWDLLSPGDSLTFQLESRDPLEVEELRLVKWEAGVRNALLSRVCFTPARLFSTGKLEVGTGKYRLTVPTASLSRGFTGLVSLTGTNEIEQQDDPVNCFQTKLSLSDTVFIDSGMNVLGFPEVIAAPDLNENAFEWLKDSLYGFLITDGKFDSDAFLFLVAALGGAIPVTVSRLSKTAHPGRLYFSRKNQNPAVLLKAEQTSLAEVLGLFQGRQLLLQVGSYLFILPFDEVVSGVPHNYREAVFDLLKYQKIWIHQKEGIHIGFREERTEEIKAEIVGPFGSEKQLSGILCRSLGSGRLYWIPATEVAWVEIPLDVFPRCYPRGTIIKTKLLENPQPNGLKRVIASLVQTAEAMNEFNRLKIGTEINVKSIFRTDEKLYVMTINSQIVLECRLGPKEKAQGQFLATVDNHSEPITPLFLSVFYGKKLISLDIPALNTSTFNQLTQNEQINARLNSLHSPTGAEIVKDIDEANAVIDRQPDKDVLLLSLAFRNVQHEVEKTEQTDLKNAAVIAANYIEQCGHAPLVNLTFALQAVILVHQACLQLNNDDFRGSGFTIRRLQNISRDFVSDLCSRALRSLHSGIILQKLLLNGIADFEAVAGQAGPMNIYFRFLKFTELIKAGQLEEESMLELVDFCELIRYREVAGRDDLELLCNAILAAAGDKMDLQMILEYSPTIRELLKLHPVFYETGRQAKLEDCHIEILREVLRLSIGEPVLLMNNLLN